MDPCCGLSLWTALTAHPNWNWNWNMLTSAHYQWWFYNQLLPQHAFKPNVDALLMWTCRNSYIRTVERRRAPKLTLRYGSWCVNSSCCLFTIHCELYQRLCLRLVKWGEWRVQQLPRCICYSEWEEELFRWSGKGGRRTGDDYRRNSWLRECRQQQPFEYLWDVNEVVYWPVVRRIAGICTRLFGKWCDIGRFVMMWKGGTRNSECYKRRHQPIKNH